jgi:Uma2 family endonuclease
MTIQTKIVTGMSLEDFLESSSLHPFELINGKQKLLMPTISIHSEIIRILFLALYLYAVETAAGEVFNETTFILPDPHNRNWVQGSRTPDVMLYSGTRLADYKAETPDWRKRPYALVPDLAIEVVSPTDRYSDIDEKIDVYLQDGVRLIWVIDPERRKVTIHAPDLENPLVLRGDANLTGGDLLPGFQIALATLFI